MARRSDVDQVIDRSKIRVFYAEAEGSTQSIQDLLRALTLTMGCPVQVHVPRNLPEGASAVVPPPPVAQEPTLFEGDERAEHTSENGNGQAAAEDTVVAARRKRGEGVKTDRNAGIVPANDLVFVPDGQPALKVFFAEKSPTNDMEQVLVFGYYLQHTLGLQEFGPSHLLAAYKHVVKPVPADLRQTIRNAKKKPWLSFTDIEHARLTTEGENVVEHDLPRAGKNTANGTN